MRGAEPLMLGSMLLGVQVYPVATGQEEGPSPVAALRTSVACPPQVEPLVEQLVEAPGGSTKVTPANIGWSSWMLSTSEIPRSGSEEQAGWSLGGQCAASPWPASVGWASMTGLPR